MRSKFCLQLKFFIMPVVVAAGVIVYLLARFMWQGSLLPNIFALAIIFLGSLELIRKITDSLLHRRFALDYIAVLTIILSISMGQLLVALIITLMLTTGQTLERYGLAKAQESLTALTDRIPHEVVLWVDGSTGERVAVDGVSIGTQVFVRRGEVVPLDGLLSSEEAYLDESSLTGEPYMSDKVRGDEIRSGTVNAGESFVLRVTKTDQNSTYRKIIELVKHAQAEKAPLIRLADRYSVIFTIITFVITVIAYLISGDLSRVLAVLVVATPCPLILATPIAFFGGINAAAKNRVLVKSITGLEVLARANHIVLDKTGTITLGQPVVSNLIVIADGWDRTVVLSVAEALERNSLHPLAKAIVATAKAAGAPRLKADAVSETLGTGISAVINGRTYALAKMSRQHQNNAVELFCEDQIIARFEFEDRLKAEAVAILSALKNLGLSLSIVTGDREENAVRILGALGDTARGVNLRANCMPGEKTVVVNDLKHEGNVVAMVGDGINDAPALAAANIGLVFSNEERTASSEAADIVFLGGDLSLVLFTINLARRTIRIALESIWVGIGLSIGAMFFAAAGLLPPIFGAALQEGIDVLVILNALRASK